jgi:serine/threonine protein kinase
MKRWIVLLFSVALAHSVHAMPIKEGVSLKDLEAFAIQNQLMPLQRAVQATKSIRALRPNLRIAKGDLFRMALFIETELDQARASIGNYLSRRKTGLARTIEFDPLQNRLYIHLKRHNQKEIGRGSRKTVTKSIMYDIAAPEIVACCTSTQPICEKNEVLQHIPGVVSMYSSTEFTQKGRKFYSTMCKLYRDGSLSEKFKKKYKFSLKQKLDIAFDLMTGLKTLHDQKLVHGNINPRKVLLDHEESRIRAVLSWAVTDSNNFASDIYALGCVLHQLLSGKEAPWINKTNIKNRTRAGSVRTAKFVYDLQRYRKARLAKLMKGKESTRDRFERLILKMVNPDAARRGTADELYSMLREICGIEQEKAVVIEESVEVVPVAAISPEPTPVKTKRPYKRRTAVPEEQPQPEQAKPKRGRKAKNTISTEFEQVLYSNDTNDLNDYNDIKRHQRQ